KSAGFTPSLVRIQPCPIPSYCLLGILVASSLATFATATVSTAAAVPAPSAAGWSRFSRAGLIHGQRSAFNGLPVEFRDGVLSVLLGTHGDKRKATRFAGEFVLHQGNFLHSASL